MAVLLSVNNLTTSLSDSRDRQMKVLDNVSFDIGHEDILGLVGESGCGKTLTALSIMGLLPFNAVSSGRIIFKGRNILDMDDKSLQHIRGREISMIFQEPMTSLNPVFTAGYQIAEVLMTHRNLSKRQALKEAEGLLKDVKIPLPELRLREYPHQMRAA